VSEMENGYSTYTDAGPSQKDIPGPVMQFETLQRNLDVRTKLHEILMQQYEVTKLAAQGEEPIFQVLQNATVPGLKSDPRRSVIVIAAIFGALFISAVIVIARDSIKAVRSDPEEMCRLRGDPR